MLGALRLRVAPRRCAVALSSEGLTIALAWCCADRVGTPGVRQDVNPRLRRGSNTGHCLGGVLTCGDAVFHREVTDCLGNGLPLSQAGSSSGSGEFDNGLRANTGAHETQLAVGRRNVAGGVSVRHSSKHTEISRAVPAPDYLGLDNVLVMDANTLEIFFFK